MDSCSAVLICEGATDVAVVGACLETKYDASAEVLETGESPTYRSKFVISDVRLGLFAPGGLEEAKKAFALMATDKAIRGRYPELKILCLVRDMNRHGSAELAAEFFELVADVGSPEVRAIDSGNGTFQLPDLSLRQILMGDTKFGANDQNAVDDHVVDCLFQKNRTELTQLSAAFEAITSNPPTSKQFVTLAMALDGHLGNPTRYYEEVIKSTSEEWIGEFIGRIGLETVIQAAIADS